MDENNGILIVDDEQDFASGLARQITRRFPDESVRVVYSGKDAIRALESRPASVMITDLRMSMINGLELLQKSLEIVPTISPIMLTAYGTIGTAVEGLEGRRL